jgi:anthranilate synthase/aminodeoxychorismate synthase-like glutamine amidotransferase
VILVLDNYDSFTWNLVQALEAADAASGRHASGGARCVVRRSDQISLSEVDSLSPEGIVLSPGPFGPTQTGICLDVVRRYRDTIPILGVCLGMQVIATVAGADVVPSGHPVHGKASRVSHDGRGVFEGLPNPILAGRYHSLIVDRASVPASLEISATGDGLVMGVRWGLAEGVLFHPESFLTEHGSRMFENFLEQTERVAHANVG